VSVDTGVHIHSIAKRLTVLQESSNECWVGKENNNIQLVD